ncbi:MAG: hypothetical protein COB50_00665 [Thiotrichales bacterium]|nr:MAG: hypothetical protein COB50_00665 [Thiotrichales bacterium]
MAILRSYLIKSTYDWIVKHNLSPHLMVNTALKGVVVPEEHVDEDGRILLNITGPAVHDLLITDTEVSFSASFSGIPYDIVVPMLAVCGLYAEETSQGIYAEMDEYSGCGMLVNEGEGENLDPLPPHDNDYDSVNLREKLKENKLRVVK